MPSGSSSILVFGTIRNRSAFGAGAQELLVWFRLIVLMADPTFIPRIVTWMPMKLLDCWQPWLTWVFGSSWLGRWPVPRTLRASQSVRQFLVWRLQECLSTTTPAKLQSG